MKTPAIPTQLSRSSANDLRARMKASPILGAGWSGMLDVVCVIAAS